MTTTRSSRRLASLAEAANYVGVCQRTIRRRIEDGTLTGYRLGTRIIRVDLDELDAAFQAIDIDGGVQ